jgi:hypothetical protein
VIDQAREYGMRVVLTLTNGDPGYGGMPQYAKWHGFDTVAGFYTLPTVKVSRICSFAFHHCQPEFQQALSHSIRSL